MIEGWYYLHTNGDLIYKREMGETVADIRDSSFARGLWPLDTSDRAGAWRILVEALAAGANLERIQMLADKWYCDDEDAVYYADYLGIRLYRDGDSWCATRGDFVNLQESDAGYGNTCLEAMAELCKELGYKPTKMWGAEFKDLVK
jgi:hypothetical protein